MQLTIVAKIEAKPGSEDLVYQELQNLIAPTQVEDGCLNYDLHRSIENPALFLFYENWTIGSFGRHTCNLLISRDLNKRLRERSRTGNSVADARYSLLRQAGNLRSLCCH